MMSVTVPPELVTVRDFLRYTVSRFNAAGLYFGHGTDNAYDEAAYLILHSLHLPLDRLEPFLSARLTAAEKSALVTLLERRVQQRIPVAYLTREAWLGEFRFYVDERVIVPRSFLAELLAEQLAPWISDPDSVSSALDLCTGSGCLAILLAHYFPKADVDAVDISPDALSVAQRNVADYDLQDRINLIRSDLFANLADKSYDLIISNPPYVTASAMAELPPEYRHEPAMALEGGEDGLDPVRAILGQASRHLNREGLLLVEVGHNRESVEEAFPSLPFVWLDTPSASGKVFLLRAEALVA
jgi:ribosomal protein L3 glutamine methyltransferase